MNFGIFSSFSSPTYTDSIETVWGQACNQENDISIRIEKFQQVKKRVNQGWNNLSTPWKDLIRESLLDVIIANLDKNEIMSSIFLRIY